MADSAPPSLTPENFIKRWRAAGAAERANYALFLTELCDLLGVSRPDPASDTPAKDIYVFEREVVFHHPDGSTSSGRIDLYKRATFVLEAKQGSAAAVQPSLLDGLEAAPARKRRGTAVRGTAGWDDAMLRARGQAEGYAKALPADEGWPPFLVIVDVGHVIELFADFSGTGKHYSQFPDASSFRITLDDLAKPDIRERLRLVWTDPQVLDPSKRAAKATREIAERLAVLARSLEAAGHNPKRVAEFLMRCLFTMFAEDVGLLPKDAFRKTLRSLANKPENFARLMRMLWSEMNKGGFSAVLAEDVLRFNGGLFESSDAIDLSKDQLALLIHAAEADWRDVEPAIFGTLLERALDPQERHRLGAHYTPRAYVERLVLPTVVEPLREDWDAVKAAAVQLANKGKLDEAAQEVRRFHEKLCETKVLDPACGSGNFLYVALEHMKRIEGEVLDLLGTMGEAPYLRDLESHTVDPHQLLGIEVNPRAAAITELVLWIGYLQWHFKTRGKTMPAQPVLRNFKNIESRDAVLTWTREELVRDERGQPITRWDGRTMKKHPTTGEDVPDESARVEFMRYHGTVAAAWPRADFIVGNPPFIGAKYMRATQGDGYAEALWTVYPDVPQAADYVMIWWHRAALEVAEGRARRFGLITTNSLPQSFGRRVVKLHLESRKPISLVFAIPDHPWVDTADGAAVRITMTVGGSGIVRGQLLEVASEQTNANGESDVVLSGATGIIHADVRIGTSLADVSALRSNAGLCSPGVKLHGSGFMVSQDEAATLGLGRVPGTENHIRHYRNGRDLTSSPRGVLVIDLFGLTEDQVRARFPEIYQWVVDRVKPERDQNNRDSYRTNWWLFGEPRAELRPALDGLTRFVATPVTSKHRFFCFLDGKVLPDDALMNVAVTDAFALGVLSSRIHLAWVAQNASTLEDRPRYIKTLCFDPFPFSECDEAKRSRIRALAEELDAHRKARQALHPDLTLTGMYNVLEMVRAGATLDKGEREIHEQALVSVLARLHEELDAAVFDAYGWPKTLTDAEILSRLVALNRERADEERRGIVRWLRPEYQGTRFGKTEKVQEVFAIEAGVAKAKKQAWPNALPEQVQAIRAALSHEVAPIAAEALARRFSGAKRDRVEEVLQTLVALGQARKVENRFAP